MFDKQIHKDNFCLRLLVTNACNKQCAFCLNDFQKKPRGEIGTLNPVIAKKIIQAYCSMMGSRAKVEISGGEPGIYPFLVEIVSCAKECAAEVKINTNGSACKQELLGMVDRWHIGVTDKSFELIDFAVAVGAQIQFVVTQNNLKEVRDIVQFYGKWGLHIKLFTNFFAEGSSKEKIELMIRETIDEYPDFIIKTRFTGVQENRGKICEGCYEKCCTKKALWVFPNGKVSPCPKGIIAAQDFSTDYMIKAFMGHQVK